MHLVESKILLGILLEAARTRSLIGHTDVEVQAYYVGPDQDVEIFDRLIEPEIDRSFFVMGEWAGEKPEYVRDRRRYQKRFVNLESFPPTSLTFASSHYRLRPVSVVLQSKRDADQEGPEAVTFRLIVCDVDNRLGLPAFLEENVQELEERERKLTPSLSVERILVHA